MTTTGEILAAAHQRMINGEVEEAVVLLAHLWSASTVVPRELTLELADRFPTSEAVSVLLQYAVDRCVERGELTTATGMAQRKLGIWRARSQADPGQETFDGHLEALDVLAGVYRAQGKPDGVIDCLTEVLEWQAGLGHRSGVAWALREMGAVAFAEGDLDRAAEHLAGADEAYRECGDDPEVVRERAGCRVALGRVRRARGDDAGARHWFEEALVDLADADAAAEVHQLLWAMEVGAPLPEPVVLAVGEFGRPDPVKR